MKFIFHVELDELSDARKALMLALQDGFGGYCGVVLGNGSAFSIKKNKSGYSIWGDK